MELGILGPLVVSRDGRPIEVRGERQRALLAALTLRAGTVVPFDRLVDEVFGDEPPRDARNALQTYMARLRQALGADGVLTRPPGYLLDLPPDAVDATRFGALIARAAERGVAAGDRLALLEEALGLWRGPALAEFGFPYAQAEAARLTELWLSAREERAAALLDLGDTASAAADLEALTVAEPWRERAVLLLVTALARAGRTPEALAACARHRDRLREDLGLDPSPELRALHQRVLRGELAQAPLTGGARRGPRVPARPTSFIGRDEESRMLRKSLAQERLITLVGPGGVGKTRLAEHACRATWWADLAPLPPGADPDAVVRAVAEAAGLTQQPGGTIADALYGWAAAAEGTLVLDNCEHVLASSAAVAERLLTTRSALRVVATSRERLGLPGERVIDVPPLREDQAVELFRDRVPLAGYAPEPQSLRTIELICRALDHLPLAIELAAARIGTLTADDLAARLDARFSLLRRGHGEDRHRTLDAVVCWSFDMLGPAEQRLFLRLSVFASAFDLSAAETVAVDDAPDGAADPCLVPRERVADLMARLVDRSMLTRPGDAGVGRYRMLETLRAYAAARLAPEEARRIRRRHAEMMARFAERAERGLTGRDELDWVRAIDERMDDLRAAWTWARDAADADLMVRLAAALARYGYWRVRTDILGWGSAVVEAAATDAAVAGHPRIARAYAAAAGAAYVDGRLDRALELARRGVEAGGGDDSPRAATALEALSDVMLVRGDLDAALAASSAQTRLAGDDPVERAIGMGNQALAHSYAGDDAAAHALAVAAADLAARSGNPTAICFTRFTEGEVLADLRPGDADAALVEAEDVATRVGNPFVACLALSARVALRGRHGPPAPATELFREAILRWRRLGNRTLLVTALRNLVPLLARTARDHEAAALAATLGRAAPAEPYGAEAGRMTQALDAVRARLTEAELSRATRAGASRTLEEAADHVIALLGGTRSAPR
ncbi:BTAD domain-containing putative transcriptional regulator [Thermopolyspora sp. NPDC052614]|uniref:BTAD domain-containing putative transcriptional regulator n=1 Tax=Thermopolyspora sp. NPDC052614 TaxID=3155682 RepID=UPI0034344E4A